MEQWEADLRAGRLDQAWDRFLDRYRRLIFAAIRHYARDYDDMMDVFAHVCEALREDDLRRLRSWLDRPAHRARFSTWLVTVIRHLTVDWFRRRDGRRRLPAAAERLPALQRQIFTLIVLDQRSHVEAFELLRSDGHPDLTLRRFRRELRATYQAVRAGGAGFLVPMGRAPEALAGREVAQVEAASDPLSEVRESLEEALESLTAEERVAVELYVLEELPAGEVARLLGLPNAKAVYNRVYRALATIRERLEQAGVTPGEL